MTLKRVRDTCEKCEWQGHLEEVNGYTDSGWAGCNLTAGQSDQLFSYISILTD